MVDKRVLVLSPFAAISYSLLSLVISWVVYDAICKSKLINNNFLFLTLMLVLLGLVSFGLTKIFGKICIFKCWLNYWYKYVCKRIYSHNTQSNEYN